LSPVSALMEASRRSPHTVSPSESPSARLWRKMTGLPPMMGIGSNRTSSETMRSDKEQAAVAAALGGVIKTGATSGLMSGQTASHWSVPDPGSGFQLRDRKTLQNFWTKEAALSVSISRQSPRSHTHSPNIPRSADLSVSLAHAHTHTRTGPRRSPHSFNPVIHHDDEDEDPCCAISQTRSDSALSSPPSARFDSPAERFASRVHHTRLCV